MKALKYLTNTAFVFSMAILASCSSDNDFEENAENNSNNENTTVGELVFTASVESDESTRASISGDYIYWDDADKIHVFCDNSNTGAPFSIIPTADNPQWATFTSPINEVVTTFNPLNYYYAVYPNVSDNTSPTYNSNTGIITASLPAQQTTSTDRTFDENAMLMVARADKDKREFAFKNIPAFIKVTISNNGNGKVKYIKIVAHNTDNRLSGSFTVPSSGISDGTVTGFSATSTAANKNSVELEITSPSNDSKEYYIPVLPCTLDKGFTIYLESEFQDGSQAIYQRVSSKSTKLSRSNVYNFGTYSVGSLTFLNDVVDLGLPSGTLWATKNIAGYNNGVDSMFTATIYDNGQYYAWGEDFGYKESSNQSHKSNESSGLGSYNWTSTSTSKTSTLLFSWPQTNKSNYSWVTYKWFTGDGLDSPTSSNVCKYVGADLKTEDDIAYLKSGGRYCMPTSTQIAELLKYSSCSDKNSPETENKKKGFKFTSNTYTSNTDNYMTRSIWLPVAGSVYNVAGGTSYRNRGSMAQYWSRSYNSQDNNYQNAYCLDIPFRSNANSDNVSYDERYSARTIRAVVTNEAIAKTNK